MSARGTYLRVDTSAIPTDYSKWRNLSKQEIASENCYSKTMMIIGAIFVLGSVLSIVLSAELGGDYSFAGDVGTYFVDALGIGVGSFFFWPGALYNAELSKYPRNIYAPATSEFNSYEAQLNHIRNQTTIESLVTTLCQAEYYYSTPVTRITVNLAELVRNGVMTPTQVRDLEALIQDYHTLNTTKSDLNTKAANVLKLQTGYNGTVDAFDFKNFKQLKGSAREKDRSIIEQAQKANKEHAETLKGLQGRWDELRPQLTGVEDRASVPLRSSKPDAEVDGD